MTSSGFNFWSFGAEANDGAVETLIRNNEIGALSNDEERHSFFIQGLNECGQLVGGGAVNEERAGAAELERGVVTQRLVSADAQFREKSLDFGCPFHGRAL